MASLAIDVIEIEVDWLHCGASLSVSLFKDIVKSAAAFAMMLHSGGAFSDE